MVPWTDASHINAVDLNVKTRLTHYRRMIGTIRGASLDLGESNWIARQLGIQENTLPSDFNESVKTKSGQYDTITCFEVVEHVMNPLRFVCELGKMLRDSESRLYISTPLLGFPGWYQFNEHFSEYKYKPFKVMLEWAGFEILREDIFCPYPFWWGLTGLRPITRVLFHRTMLFEVRKKP